MSQPNIEQETLNYMMNQPGSSSSSSLQPSLNHFHKQSPTLYVCFYCGRSFQNGDQLRDHNNQTHIIVRRHQCRYCLRVFSCKNHVDRHELTHTGEKPFKCKYCQNLFRQKCSLISHERVHTGERPFQCKYCENKFSHQSTLDRHLRIHTGEKPYNCRHCQKPFRQVSHKNTHELAIHSQGAKYKCSCCDIVFNSWVNKAQHEASQADTVIKPNYSQWLTPISIDLT